MLTKALRPIALRLLDAGLDVRKIAALRHYPKYWSHCKAFIKFGGNITKKHPILTDYDDQAGTARGHYFHQDLLVASLIHKKNPGRHIDIGSRIDGFVAHIASFRKIEVMDVRDLHDPGHENISFIRANLMDPQDIHRAATDSISCLHALEHFGLGRYGDPIDPDGHIKGFNNIVDMVIPGGTIYISVPVASETKVHFNAHRIFHPMDIFSWPNDPKSVNLSRFDLVDDSGLLHKDLNIAETGEGINFGCGIYTFTKS